LTGVKAGRASPREMAASPSSRGVHLDSSMSVQPSARASVAPGPQTGIRRERKTASVAVFVIATYLGAWAVWAYWVPTMPASGMVMTPGFLAAAMIGGFAPTLAALLVLALAEGRESAVALLRQALHWRAPLRWYLIAILTVPAVTALSLWLQGATFATFSWSGWAAMIPIAIGWPLMAALGEEFGWRGFALPRLEARRGAIGAAMILGLVWGFWHLPADYIGLKGMGWWFVPAFLVSGPLVLTAHSVIMSWIWNRAGRSLPPMLVYHFGITATAILTPAVVGTDGEKVLSSLVTAAGFWLVALGLLVFRRSDFAPATATTPPGAAAPVAATHWYQ